MKNLHDSELTGNDSAFPNGYGRFPYLIVRAGMISSFFYQVPIHFVKKGETANSEGLVIDDFPYDYKNITDNDVADIVFERLIDEAAKYQKNNTKLLYKGKSYVSLIFNPEMTYMFSDNGHTFCSSPPAGQLRTISGNDIPKGSQHYRNSEYEEFLKAKWNAFFYKGYDHENQILKKAH